MRYFLLLILALVFGASAFAQDGGRLVTTAEGCSVWTFHEGENLTATWSGACIDGFGDGAGVLELNEVNSNGVSELYSTYEGALVTGHMHGQGTYTFADGSVYTGEFRNGDFEGFGIKTYADGGRYEGGWQTGNFHGQGTYTWANGDVYAGEFRNGDFEGFGIKTFANGSRVVGQWEHDDLVNGTCYVPGQQTFSCSTNSSGQITAN